MSVREDVRVTEPNETSERILQAVIDGLQELDPAALTIQQVCRRAEVKAPTVYYYFGNKEGLIAAAVDLLVTRWVRQLDALVDRSGSLDVAMRQAVSAWELMITVPERPFAVFVWVSMWSAESRVALLRARAAAQALIAEALVTHLATDEADDLAGLLIEGVIGAAVDYQLDLDTDTLNRRLTTLLRVVQAATNGTT